MTAKITPTDEQRRVLDDNDTPVIFVRDDGQATHVIVPIDEARRLFDDYLRRELKIGFDQADRGELQPWDIDQTLAEAHRRHANRTDS